MQPAALDWIIFFSFLGIVLLIGVWCSRRAGRDDAQFFLSGRELPWWLLGMSMVATTFSTDTPNLVTDIVRKNGVAGNWVWWAFLLTGMLTVFLYARLWRRSGVFTDIEFYEVRYSGRTAAFLRGFRALYLGVFFNVIIMASVSLAAIKIGGVMFGFSPVTTLLVASLVTVIFSALGGFRGVILTDFLLFFMAMTGAVAAAWFALSHPQVGGLAALIEHPNLVGKLNLFPVLESAPGGGFTDESLNLFVALFLIPIAVQWWSVWYPGAEPGGGGYIAQRILAARDERHAVGATFFFNVAHYALRPWPWIIVALASLVVFPDLQSVREAFPNVASGVVNDDLAYSAMLTFLPTGWLGIVLVSLVAAYMSTISTHLNWGSSYVVNDFYKRFVRPEAPARELVLVGRTATAVLMVMAGGLTLALSNALQVFHIMLQVGAGTGLLFILRWFWWRINALSELTAMIVSFLVAVYFQFIHTHVLPQWPLADWHRLILGVGITTVAWVCVTLITKPTDQRTLESFCERVNPGGPGWRRIFRQAEAEGRPIRTHALPVNIGTGILRMLCGCAAVYAILMATGFILYNRWVPATTCLVIALLAAVWLFRSIQDDKRKAPDASTPSNHF